MNEGNAYTQMLERLNLVPGKGKAETTEEETERLFGFLPGVQDRANNVEFRTRDYPWHIMEYLWLQPPTLYEPGRLLLHYVTGHRVEILGRNLRPLAEQLRRHRLTWVREAAEGERAGEGELFVDEIRVYAPEDADRGRPGERP